MDEKQLKQLYKAEMESSAPDMQALWTRIEGGLKPKAPSADVKACADKTCKKPLYITLGRITAGATACIALLLVIPAVLETNSLLSDQTADAPMANDSLVAEDNNDVLNEATDGSESHYHGGNSDSDGMVVVKPVVFLSYSELSFSSYSETVLSCTGTPYGDSYFVEEQVLKQTEQLVRGTVNRVYLSNDGSDLCYELSVTESYPAVSESVVVVNSRSPYAMRRGREYLIPLVKTEKGYRTVYDNVPQIEFTADGGIVYYNGWQSLDSGHSQSLIYPQTTADAFFYDRMMYLDSGDISGIIRKWKTTNNI